LSKRDISGIKNTISDELKAARAKGAKGDDER
jgi:hypothetical protein